MPMVRRYKGKIMWLVIVIALVLALFVWQFIATKKALSTTVVRTRVSPMQSVDIINGAFSGARGLLWTDENGPGTINKRRRGKDRGITMSITVEPTADGGSEVSMWASQYTEYLLLFANFAGAVNSRKNAIVRKVA